MGVCQGASLGPLPYCVFANDLSLFAEDAVVVQYADDTQILVSGKKTCMADVVAELERVLASLDIWFRGNGLKVNAEKTQLMFLGSHQNLRNTPDVTVNFRDHHLLPSSEAKNLGLTFDRTLSWDSHVSNITRRCFGTLAGLSHLRGYLPPSVISALVNALVLSQIRYCISVYGNGTQKNMSRLQKVINYGAKVIFGRKKFDRVSDLLKRLGWMSAESLASYHTLCLLHKVRLLQEPASLAGSISTVAEHRDADRETRQDGDLFVPRWNTGMGRRRFVCRGPDQYNDLPPELRALPAPRFGRHLKRYLTRLTVGE